MDHVRTLQTGELLLIPGDAGVVPVFRRKLFFQAVLRLGMLPIMIRQHCGIQMPDTLFVMADLNRLLFLFVIQHNDFISQCRNGAALLIQPQQIQLGQLVINVGDLRCDFDAAQVCGLFLCNGILHEETAEERLFLLHEQLPDGLLVPQLLLNLCDLLLQPGNSLSQCPPADKRIVHSFPGYRAGDVALIEHSVCCNCDLEIAQLLNSVTAHHPSQQVIHIAAGQRIVCLHFFRKTVLPGTDLLPLPELAHIHQTEGRGSELVFYPIENRKCGPVVRRIDQQIELLCVKVALHRSAPQFIGYLQHIRQDVDGNRLSDLALQLTGQSPLQLQQALRVILDSLPEIRQGQALLVPLLFQFCPAVLQPVPGTADHIRKHRRRLPGIFERRQRMGKHFLVSGTKDRIGFQDAPGSFLHRRKEFILLLPEDCIAQFFQPKRFSSDFLRQGLQILTQLFLFFQQPLLTAAQLLLLLKYTALRTGQVQLPPSVLLLRDLIRDFPDARFNGS